MWEEEKCLSSLLHDLGTSHPDPELANSLKLYTFRSYNIIVSLSFILWRENPHKFVMGIYP